MGSNLRSHKTAQAEEQIPGDILDWTKTYGLSDQIAKIAAIVNGPFGHPVILLTGYEGIGKRHVALGVAASLFCELGQSCGQCGSCLEVMSAIHPELLVIHGRPVSSLKTTDMQAFQEHIQTKSSLGRRVAIITDCDRMTREASNRILKTLEEPPEKVLMILTTSKPLSLPETILGRCLKLRVIPPNAGHYLASKAEQDASTYAEVKAYLQELVAATRAKDVIDVAAKLVAFKSMSLEFFLKALEWELNRHYKSAEPIQTVVGDPVVTLRRRQLLSELRRFSVHKKIALNTQLALESIGLVKFLRRENGDTGNSVKIVTDYLYT
jgi:hypothetical protein